MEPTTIKSQITTDQVIMQECGNDISMLAHTTLSNHWVGVSEVCFREGCLSVTHSGEWSEYDTIRFHYLVSDIGNLIQHYRTSLGRFDLFIITPPSCQDVANNCGKGCVYCIKAILPLLRMTQKPINHEIIIFESNKAHYRNINKRIRKYKHLMFLLTSIYQLWGILIPHISQDVDLYLFIISPELLAEIQYKGEILPQSEINLSRKIKNLQNIYNHMVDPMYHIT